MSILKEHAGNSLAERSTGDDAEFLVQIICFSCKDREQICDQPVTERILIHGIRIEEIFRNLENLGVTVCLCEIVIFFFVQKEKNFSEHFSVLMKCGDDIALSAQGIISDDDGAGEKNHHVAGQFSLMKKIRIFFTGDDACLTDRETFLDFGF